MEDSSSKVKRICATAIAMIRDIGVWWGEGNVALMAGATAFYSMLSLAPLLAFAISVAGLFVAQAVAEYQLLTTVAEIFGQETADFLAEVIRAAVRLNGSGPMLAIIGLFLTIFFASTVFNSLKLALNAIWAVQAKNTRRSSILTIVWNRLLASGMVIVTSAALTLTMLFSVIRVDVSVWLTQHWPQLAGIVSTYRRGLGAWDLLLVAGLMMVAYKVLPDVRLTWRQVLPGALLVTVLFMLGNEMMKIYFSWSVLPTVYGAAGSLVMVLLWIYYLSYIFFLGALVTRAYVQHVHWGVDKATQEKAD
jgi:YihY family inner membrane protein